ncbi:amidohydrolase family protein [Sphingomonas sp. PR090111-T3T-6A]|uniref:amidohydrolase family protein n=1 Tax=Sphingomonas sp. PR090111-T3T-6A TaxID=685778 RepID=UPI000364E787|nr:amidohydrolase family protein [Sphingomonas sp. PR090111-T3T-6A]
MKAALLSLAALIAAPAAAETVAIVGGTVAIGDGSAPIQNGTVLFRDGRIVGAGANVAVPAGATVVDAHGKWVAAGMVAGLSDLGLVDADGIGESNDQNAGHSPFAAAIDIAPAINPNGVIMGVERAGGITRSLVSAGTSGSIFGGQGAAIGLGVDAPPVTRARAFQYVELGEDGGREAGGSRPAAYAMLHEALAEAADYRRDPKGFGGREKGSLVKRPDAAALLPVLGGKMPLLVHVERASDIRSVLALRTDYPKLRLVLVGASEGWMVAREIADAHVPVIAAALADLPEEFERVAATESNVGRLQRAGVTVAISTVDASAPAQQRNLTQYAGNLVAISRIPGATGLDWGHAFETITSAPAAAIGMDGEIGSLRAGRRADVVVWDGDPLELSSAPVAIYIDGRPQPTTSRQTELLRRYLTPSEGALPKAYQH